MNTGAPPKMQGPPPT